MKNIDELFDGFKNVRKYPEHFDGPCMTINCYVENGSDKIKGMLKLDAHMGDVTCRSDLHKLKRGDRLKILTCQSIQIEIDNNDASKLPNSEPINLLISFDKELNPFYGSFYLNLDTLYMTGAPRKI